MTQEYGYLGAVDVGTGRVPNLQSNGEPIYTPALENRWAKELQSDDGAWRFLKGGSASGRGVNNVFDATLADNFTVLCLGRAQRPNYNELMQKGSIGSTVGWWVKLAPQAVNNQGFYARIDHTIGAAITKAAFAKPKDLCWHWYAMSLTGTNVYSWLNGGGKQSETRSAGDLTNAQNFVTGAANGQGLIAATLIYNRVLTDTEVSNIMLGKQMPKEVSGLVGYYKFNESHGNASGQCTDYSGQGNHLTYSGAVWEKFDPTSTAKTNFASGQPYVLRSQINPANWWERMPPAIADPERMGCAYVGGVNIPYNVLMNITGDLSYGGWVRPLRPRSTKTVTVLNCQYITAAGPVSVTLTNAKRVDVIIGDTASATSTQFTLTVPLQFGVFYHAYVTLSGTSLSLYLNGVLIGTQTNAAVHGAPSGTLAIFDTASGAQTGGRSIRLFSRALSAAEVNELFLTDKIANRSGLVGEWLCNTPHTTTITDTSGNGLHTTTSNPLLLDSPYTVPRRKRKGKQLAQSTGGSATFPAGLLASITGLSQLTLSCWVKLQKGSGQYPSLMRLENSGQTIAELFSLDSGGVLYAVARSVSTDTAQIVSLNGTKVAPFNQWFLFSLSIDLAAATVSAYLNGKLYGTLAATFGQSTFATCTGGRVHGAIAKRNAIDAARIYNRALTAQEHYNLYLDQAPRNGLVAEYKFDNDATNCKDTSGNGYHATWSGITAANYVQEM